ncbi:MAG: CAP domain-containing protein [Bacteroidota bacterium]
MNFLPLLLIISVLGIGCATDESKTKSVLEAKEEIRMETPAATPISLENDKGFKSSESYIEIKKEVLKHSNIYRNAQKRRTLSVKSELNKIAQKHSDDMAAGRVDFSHAGFQKRFNAVKKYASFPVSVAENLYATTDPRGVGEEAVKAWILSPGHKKNLRGKFIYSGIGVSKSSSGEYFVVQLYVGKSNK